MGVGAYLRHEQMLCLQNYENLAMIVSKAFGGSSENKNVKVSSSSADLDSIIALANG